MTDLLLKPDDTGDIPTGVGETTPRIEPGMSTQNLVPYVNGLAPALRRPTATLALLDYGKAPSTPPTLPPAPDPLPPPPPPTPSSVWEDAPAPPYVGRHRRWSFWGWLSTPLAAGLEIVRAALAKEDR